MNPYSAGNCPDCLLNHVRVVPLKHGGTAFVQGKKVEVWTCPECSYIWQNETTR